MRLGGDRSAVDDDRMSRRAKAALIGALVLVLAVPPLAAGQLGPLNDLLSLGQGGGQTPAKVAVQRNAEPPFVATPQAGCLPGSKPEPGIQGRVPGNTATNGLHCNVDLVAHQGTSGGFKVLRYTDSAGHDCAYYDTALLYPLNALKLDATSQGVAVLDMSDPAHPVQTDTLKELPMLSPHESLNLNPKRGLLAAVLGNPTTYPGLVSIYDASADCRHPVLQSTKLVARFGHESGFSEDGKTFYAAGTAVSAISAIDVTNPKEPHSIWQGNVMSHGLTLSPDGNRAYVADPTGGDMLILDTSEIQARKPNPQAREISRLTWTNASIPQNAIPFTSGGKKYVLEFDEYTAGTTSTGSRDAVGAVHIIDINDETHPRVIANLRLQVNQPADHAAAQLDPGAVSPAQGYAAHYCNLSSTVDPKVVACSFITSGLRVFDISELTKPREIGYYVAPTRPRAENGFMASDFAMSKPVIVPERREIWYTDGTTGFNVLRVDKRVWPDGSAGDGSRSGSGRSCLAARSSVGTRGIGRVRLKMTRAQLAKRLPAPVKKTKRSWRWCVKGGKGTVAAAFTRRGHVALVAATGTRYGNRRVFPGSSSRKLARAYPRRKRVSGTLVRASRTSPRLFGVRRGKVRYVAVTSRAVASRPRDAAAYVRYAGLAGAATGKGSKRR